MAQVELQSGKCFINAKVWLADNNTDVIYRLGSVNGPATPLRIVLKLWISSGTSYPNKLAGFLIRVQQLD